MKLSSVVTPEIEARISLLPSQDGGRTGPILSGEYRGVLSVDNENFSVRISVPEEISIKATEPVIVGIQFLFPETALSHFPIGTNFQIWEGKIIGHGHVLKVLYKT